MLVLALDLVLITIPSARAGIGLSYPGYISNVHLTAGENLTFEVRVYNTGENENFLYHMVADGDIEAPLTEIRTVIYPTADIYAFGEYWIGYSRTQLKFDISGIPLQGRILSAKLWLYRLAADGWDGGVTLNRVDDQLWSENITASQFDAQILTNGENYTSKFTTHGWDNLDALNQLDVDYSAGHAYTSFRLRWANDNGSEPSIGVDDGRFLAIESEFDNLEVVFYSSEYNGRDPYLEVVYVPPYAVSVSISPSYQSGLPMENLSYIVTVKNIGNLDDNYILTASDNTGWGPTVLPTSLFVASGSTGEATLTVTVPENAKFCSIDNITVTATSRTDNTVSDDAWCEAHVEVVRGVEISISPSYQSGLPGENLGYTVTIRNLGNVDDNYDLIAQDNEDWRLSIASSIMVPAFENRTTTLTVTIPDNAMGCTKDNVTVAATSQADNTVSDNDSCTAHVQVVRGVEVSIEPKSRFGVIGENVVFTVTVKNIGNVWDNYKLENNDDAGWTLELDNDYLEIPKGENRETKLTVSVPDNENLVCTTDNIIVIATGIDNAEVTGNDTATVHVVSPWMGAAAFKLEDLYKLNLYKDNLWLYQGSKLVVKFYKYDNSLENENVIHENFALPWHVVPENENVEHPRIAGVKTGVKKAKLWLVDNAGNEISKIKGWVTIRDDLWTRLVQIASRWPYAPPGERDNLWKEIGDVASQWPYAPSTRDPIWVDC